jgi:phosphoglycerol transferase MdoB-like AlkP superfamily enzyme
MYDRRVPVVLFGAGIKAGQYLRVVTPADIAPTLAHLCGVTLANPDGDVLVEAVAGR